MNWSDEFVRLDKSVHDRLSFDCGEVDLNDFLQKRASRNMEAGISTTMVLPASELVPNGKHPICAFYTVAPGSIARETLPSTLKKKLPHYPVPVFLIAQLAVNSACQGKGLGRVSLINALEYLWGVNALMKSYAVIVNCLNEDLEGFYSRYGFQVLSRDGDRTTMFLPMKTIGALFQ